jgi:hypothetical protein
MYVDRRRNTAEDHAYLKLALSLSLLDLLELLLELHTCELLFLPLSLHSPLSLLLSQYKLNLHLLFRLSSPLLVLHREDMTLSLLLCKDLFTGTLCMQLGEGSLMSLNGGLCLLLCCLVLSLRDKLIEIGFYGVL